jgi:UDP-glucose 4-epimerase
MKILLTGGAGFIASHVADAYIDAGHEVVIVDNLATGYLSNVNPKAKFYLLDICSQDLSKVMSVEKPDVVNHHAAQISVPYSVKEPLLDERTNVWGFINLLQNSVRHNVKKIIFSSSGGAIYGEADELPTPETCNPSPMSPYAINKLIGEQYLRFYKQQHGLDYTILRYANVFGPRQLARGEAGVVSIFIEKLLANQQPELYAFADAPEGMVRDYVYVKDAVKANLKALASGDGEIFNIGTGIGTTTLDLFKEIARQLGSELEPVLAEPRPGDLRHSVLNCKKAEVFLQWTPAVTLADGIAETINYIKSL